MDESQDIKHFWSFCKSSRYLYLRMLVFWSLESLRIELSNTRELSEISKIYNLVLKCQDMQPLGERIHFMMSDMTSWLTTYDGKLVDIDRESIFIYQSAWEDLFVAPHHKITDETLNSIAERTGNVRTSSDMFSHLIKGIKDYMHRFVAIQRDMKVAEDIMSHSGIKTMKLKTETLFRVIAANLKNGAISHAISLAISEKALAVLGIYDPDPSTGLIESANEVNSILSALKSKSLTNTQYLEPTKSRIEITNSHLIRMLEKKRFTESKQLKSNAIKQYDSRKVDGDEIFSVFTKEELETDGEHGETMLDMTNIWIEIESTFRRIVSLSETNTKHSVMCSEHPGRFRFSTEKLMWFGVPKDLEQYVDEIVEQKGWQLAIVIPFESITNVVIDYVSNKRWGAIADNPEFVDLCKKQFLAIHTATEVYRLFPFSTADLSFIKDALEQIAKIKPVFQDHYIRTALTAEIVRNRRHILKTLVASDRIWIESSDDIRKSICKLAYDSDQIDLVELEYLFHSCRRESAVTIEAVVILQEVWNESISDEDKIRICKIIDRLLNPLVMHQNDPAFVILYAWLRAVEPLLNPYKNISVLACISSIIRRCKCIVLEQLNPIVATHGKTIFHHWDEYNSWRTFYNQSEGAKLE